MATYIFIPVIILTTFLVSHFTVSEIENNNKINFSYHIDLEKPEKNILSNSQTAHFTIIQQPPQEIDSKSKTSNNKYTIFKTNPNQGIVERFLIPDNSVKEQGYVTHPEDGSFFIWYPVLGNKTYIYDTKGNFLWNTTESRYLQIDKTAKWILAMSGDQSGVEFLKPNFKSLIHSEGILVFKYQFKNESVATKYDACTGFLNGDIVFFHLNTEPAFFKRISLKQPTKSLSCNFTNNSFIAQVRQEIKDDDNKTLFQDALVYINIDTLTYNDRNIANDPKIEFTIPLPMVYPYTLPLIWNSSKNIGAFVSIQPNNQTTISIFNKKKIITTLPWNVSSETFDSIDNFRIEMLHDYFIISSSNGIMILDEKNILLSIPLDNIEQISSHQNLISIKHKLGLTGFSFSNYGQN